MAKIRTLPRAQVGGSLDAGRAVTAADIGGGEVAGAISGALGVAADIANQLAVQAEQSAERQRLVDSTRISGEFKANRAEAFAQFQANPGDINTFTKRYDEDFNKAFQETLQGIPDERTRQRVEVDGLRVKSVQIPNAIRFESTRTIEIGQATLAASIGQSVNAVGQDPSLLESTLDEVAFQNVEAFNVGFIQTEGELDIKQREDAADLTRSAMFNMLANDPVGLREGILSGEIGQALTSAEREDFVQGATNRINGAPKIAAAARTASELSRQKVVFEAIQTAPLTVNQIEGWKRSGMISEELEAKLLSGFDLSVPEPSATDKVLAYGDLSHEAGVMQLLLEEDPEAVPNDDIIAFGENVLIAVNNGLISESEGQRFYDRFLDLQALQASNFVTRKSLLGRVGALIPGLHDVERPLFRKQQLSNATVRGRNQFIEDVMRMDVSLAKEFDPATFSRLASIYDAETDDVLDVKQENVTAFLNEAAMRAKTTWAVTRGFSFPVGQVPDRVHGSNGESIPLVGGGSNATTSGSVTSNTVRLQVESGEHIGKTVEYDVLPDGSRVNGRFVEGGP